MFDDSKGDATMGTMNDPIVVSNSNSKLEPKQWDISQILSIEKKVSDITDINIHNGPTLMMIFARGYSLARSMWVKAKKSLEEAEEKSKTEFGLAALDRADKWIEELRKDKPTLKDSMHLRKMYAESKDEEYLKSRDKVRSLRALVEYFHAKMSVFDKAHDDAKSIYRTVIKEGEYRLPHEVMPSRDPEEK